MRETMLVLHFIGLAMGLGTNFAFMFLGKAAAKMDEDEGAKFMQKALAVSRMGHIGLALLIISGGYLMTGWWKILPENPLLIAKLCLVVVLIVLVSVLSTFAKKARQRDPQVHLKKARPFGPLAMLTGISIVVLAVLQFQ